MSKADNGVMVPITEHSKGIELIRIGRDESGVVDPVQGRLELGVHRQTRQCMRRSRHITPGDQSTPANYRLMMRESVPEYLEVGEAWQLRC